MSISSKYIVLMLLIVLLKSRHCRAAPPSYRLPIIYSHKITLPKSDGKDQTSIITLSLSIRATTRKADMNERTALLRDHAKRYSPNPIQEQRRVGDDVEEHRRQSGENIQSGDEPTDDYKFAVACICVLEFFERLAYFGVLANLVLYCTTFLRMSIADATTVNLVFAGAGYMSTVVGGYISDLYPGKFLTIILSGIINIIGLLLLIVTVHLHVPGSGFADFYVALALVGLGSGGIQANLGPFGAQQIVGKGRYSVQSFFNWFYWARNLGAVLANTIIVYVQQYDGFEWGYLGLLAGMVAGLVVFILPRNRYRGLYSRDHILSKSFVVCYKGCCNRMRPSTDSVSYGEDIDEDLVNGVFGVLHVLPILGFFIIYWTVYTQMSTSYLLQSERLDMHIGGIMLPAAIPTVFNNLIILIVIPFMDCVLYPFLSRIQRRPNYLRRIGIGFVAATLSLIAAGVLEIYRKRDIEVHGAFKQKILNAPLEASRLSLFAQVPQFALIGLSEIFASISGFEFAYMQAPIYMQGLVTGLFCMTQGLGSFVQLLIVAVANAVSSNDWFPPEPNKGHMEYVLFFMAGINTVNLIGFVIGARYYKAKRAILRTNEEIST